MPLPDELSAASGTTPLRPIADFQLVLPPTWARIPVAPKEGTWPDAVAEYLCDDGDVRKALATALAATHGDLLGPNRHVLAAVWVPDRGRPHMHGLLTVDWMLPEPDAVLDLAFYRALVQRSKRPSIEILTQITDEVVLPAGPALHVRERTSRKSGRMFSRREPVTECVRCTVFPPGGSDALQLAFQTDALDLGDAMAADADAMLKSLAIVLGEPDAAT